MGARRLTNLHRPTNLLRFRKKIPVLRGIPCLVFSILSTTCATNGVWLLICCSRTWRRAAMTKKFLKCLLLAAMSVTGFQLLVCASQSLQSQSARGREAVCMDLFPFPSNSLWNTNIANAPVDPNSDAIINFIGSTIGLHPDFGSGQYQGQSIGIPYVVVPVTQPLVNINFTAYGDESDPGPMPIPINAPIEGYPNPGRWRSPRAGDRQRQLLALRALSRLSAGQWNLESGFGGGVGPDDPTSSGPIRGRRPMPQGCLSSPGWFATTKWPLGRSTTPCALRCNTANRRLPLPHRIGRQTPAIHWRHPWECVCV